MVPIDVIPRGSPGLVVKLPTVPLNIPCFGRGGFSILCDSLFSILSNTKILIIKIAKYANTRN